MKAKYNQDIHHRKSIRLRGYDYTGEGAYYITVVTHGRFSLFGDIVDGDMRLNDAGQIIVDAWKWLGIQYQYVALDSYVVMPNHLHGVIVIADPDTDNSGNWSVHRKPLGRLVAAFKTVSTKQFNLVQNTLGQRLWQRNYYEHVIRNDDELDRVRKYISDNPSSWETDRENPALAQMY